VEGAVEPREGRLAARVRGTGDEKRRADLQLVGRERLDDAVVRAHQQRAGNVVARRREGRQRASPSRRRRAAITLAGGGVSTTASGRQWAITRGLERVDRVETS
jgi:hypothetical protein